MSCGCAENRAKAGCSNKTVETEYLGDVAIFALDSLPDYLLAEVDTEDPLSKDIIRTLVRVPTGRLFPNGAMANVTTLNPNNDELEIPEAQVRAGRVVNLASVNQVQYADAENPAQFLMLGKLAGMVLIQASGTILIPQGHQYIIGADYYVGDNGAPTTDPTSGQKLFIPISKTQLLVTL